jgi:hypothetical protein
VPQACSDWAETIAAYRFFNNEADNWRAILKAHTDCAMTRMAVHEVVLCIQDTTGPDCDGLQASVLAPLSYDAQRWVYVHPTCAVSTSREPPEGEKPIERRLYTILPVASLEHAARRIDWYLAFGEIEMFFYRLKNGCRTEAL